MRTVNKKAVETLGTTVGTNAADLKNLINFFHTFFSQYFNQIAVEPWALSAVILSEAFFTFLHSISRHTASCHCRRDPSSFTYQTARWDKRFDRNQLKQTSQNFFIFNTSLFSDCFCLLRFKTDTRWITCIRVLQRNVEETLPHYFVTKSLSKNVPRCKKIRLQENVLNDYTVLLCADEWAWRTGVTWLKC